VQERYPAAFRILLRKISRATDERSAIACIAPFVAVGDTLIQFSGTTPEWAFFFVACLNSFAFDFIARLRVSGTSLTQWIVRQIPILKPNVNGIATKEFVDSRSKELSVNDIWTAQALIPAGEGRRPFL
jgi:hypothetical protein